MSKAEFEQEYLASFNVFEGQIWQYAGSDISSNEFLDYDKKEYDCIFGVDWGFRDHTGVVVALYSWSQDKFFIVDEYMKNERTTDRHAKALLKMIDKWDPDIIYTDSAAAQTKFDLAQDYGISMTNAKKSILGGIGYVGSLFENKKIEICLECTHVLESVDQYQWDNREGLTKEKPSHKGTASHLADALRYLCFSFARGGAGIY